MYSKFKFLFLLLLFTGAFSYQVSAESEKASVQLIQDIFEPSGVVQLNDGRLLVVEDEPTNPFVLLTPNPDATSFSTSNLRANILFHPALGHVGDLEGVAKDPNGNIYAITSHSRKSNGKRDPERERIVRLTFQDNQLVQSSVRSDFRKKLIKAFPSLKQAAKERDVKDELGLNIEGLAFSPDGNVLWVGLRAPLVDEKAILVGVLNPEGALESDEPFQFISVPILLDLDNGGIRGMAYDPILSGYLILSQRESTKKEKAFKLWLWSGNAKTQPSRVRITGITKLKSTEGITPVSFNGKNQLLLVNDDGDRANGISASYLLVDYEQLDIEAVQ